MDRLAKIKLLTRAAQFDLCTSTAPVKVRVAQSKGMTKHGTDRDLAQWLYPASLPNGRHLALLKVLQTNMCDNNCLYCGLRRERTVPRCEFSPDELAASFDRMVRRGIAQGLFLSSAVYDSAPRAQERMIATVELLRFKYQFSGYVHLKLLPGCGPAAVERSVELADRVSVNLEAPNRDRLARLSHDKRFEEDLLRTMLSARHFLGLASDATTDITTQFVVGAAGETDREILTTVEHLQRRVDLARVYFSAFRPLPDTPLESVAATPLLRENRLYQSHYLMRRYGFVLDDLCFDEDDQLCRDTDPKMAWALRHPEFFPVEVNGASKAELLRIPGIGPRSASRILRLRRGRAFRDLRDLRVVGAVATRAAPFVLLNGKSAPSQLALC
jgi:predicted DNA-binding helix-hairpin-helix protein